jgi:hypothetical protein
MTDSALIGAIRDGIRNEMAAHVGGMRDDLAQIRSDIAAIRANGCHIGAANREACAGLLRRLDALDARAATAGGIVGALAAVAVAVVEWFTRRGGN